MKAVSSNQSVYALSLVMLTAGGACLSNLTAAQDQLEVVSKPVRQRIHEETSGPFGLVIRTERVSLIGLDVSVAADAAVIHSRLLNAARDVCDRNERHDALLEAGFAKCVRLSLGKAMAEVDQRVATGMERSLGEFVLATP